MDIVTIRGKSKNRENFRFILNFFKNICSFFVSLYHFLNFSSVSLLFSRKRTCQVSSNNTTGLEYKIKL